MDMSASATIEGPDVMGIPEDDDGILDYDGDLDLDDADDLDVDTVIDEHQHPESAGNKVTYQEQIRMIHLRSHINQLVEKVEAHQYTAEKTREEQKKCQSHIQELTSERDRLFMEIEQNETDNNTAALYRLRSAHERVCREIQGEGDLEKVIAERLEDAEYELAKTEVEHGKFILIEADLLEREEQLAADKTAQAMVRLKKEQKYADQAGQAQRKRERDQREAIRAREDRHRHAVEEAKRSQERANKYLNITLNKLRTREKEEENRYESDMKKKIEMLVKLKNDIAANRENLRALRARDKAREREETFMEQEERRRISQDGGNPDEVLLIKKRLNDFERQKTQFEDEQVKNKSEILGRILLEESRMRQRKKQQPQLWDDPKRHIAKMVEPHKKKTLKVFEEYTKMTDGPKSEETLSLSPDLQPEKQDGVKDDTEDEDERQDTFREMGISHKLLDSSDSTPGDSEDDQHVNLAKPEFEGLWDQHKPYKVPKDVDSHVKLPGASKMDQEILAKVLDKHREGIIVKQVAAGKEFTGCPFYSKPDIIHFKDFNVGHCYKKKVILTNVSYTVNYCKFVGITERLKDFIHIDFDPPGQMSAGLTCEMMVTFKPMINEDLVGEVNFLSQTGPFAIPLRCTTKKCDLHVDSKIVEFGTTVIGETLKRTVTLSNKGALGTKFEFFKVTGMKQRTCTTAETSLGRLTTADTLRAMSPDSVEFTDKAKSISLTDRGPESRKKMSMDDLGEIPEQSPELTPSDGHPLPDGAVLPESSGVTADGLPGMELKPMELDGEVASPDFAISEMDDYGTLDGMRVGQVVTGEIGPFSSVKLEIIWQPTIPGKVDTEFLVTFSDPLSDVLSVSALGTAMDVPVWVERQTVDLRICMLDRLFQDTVIVNNRATTALRLRFEVCKELRNHLELLPKTGYIQAQSQFSAQLKFLPRKSLFEEAGKYFDKETGVLEAPLLIRVADQTQPVPFTVTAVVTNSDMMFDVSNIDFGCCTIYESVKTSIQLTNKSILPQPYGFVGHPDYVEIQPNDGFGTLLPLETIELHVIFSPPKARDYKFDLCCKSLINRQFKIQCKGVGVHPPLELSQQVIHFAATSLYDVSTASLHVINSHTSSNEFTHPVPRIGKGEIAPVGPTSFEFVLPEDCPLTISPTVGTIEPGKKCRIQLRFSPMLKECDIRKEAVRMATRIMEAQADREYREALKKEKEQQEQAQKAAAAAKKPAKGKVSPKPAGKGKGQSPQTPGGGSSVAKPGTVTPPEPDSISKDSAAYAAAIGSLLRQYKGGFKTCTVPCYVASGTCGNPGELPYSIHNTLYLEVHCPVVKPPIVVISDNGKTTLDFGEVSIGQHTTKSVTIQNISDRNLELQASLLDTTGPFQNLNALRMLSPGATHTAVISFTPTAGRVFHEVLEIHSPTATLYLTLTGRGVSPIVNLSIDSELFDMGSVLSGEYVERPFKIHNTSSLSIDYVIKMDSLSLLRHAKSQLVPSFVDRDKSRKVFVGTQNNNGQNVFDLVPSEGTIEAGASKEILVTFAPDHASDHYSDGVRIELFNQEESHFFQLTGIAKDHIMYLEGGEDLTPDVESLSFVPVPTEEDGEELKPSIKPLLITLSSVAKDDEYMAATRDIYVGCVRTMAVSQKKEGKKNGEFQIENLQLLQAKGFNMDPQRGMIEAGTRKPITITWTPPSGYDPTVPTEGSVIITLKGDLTEQYKVIVRAMVITE
ncbi:LOW QUALITY PROTEIN: cilia- and flagella-associated protein 74-like [Haliotis rubra]|uniref:LOW QUALITY PROTEIN: cilia- and flagella-associated protein 74-like n=1 Tax=Haliotis rubra TaxID=36100 RepID=UPI001EE5F6C3|nr:LOW QUALITY PROTEIN: cilia- and flagella-associated protein 74-like [Haliotis rubra]